jgi:hypothetical protein
MKLGTPMEWVARVKENHKRRESWQAVRGRAWNCFVVVIFISCGVVLGVALHTAISR